MCIDKFFKVIVVRVSRANKCQFRSASGTRLGYSG